MLHMKFNVYKLFTDRQTDRRPDGRTLKTNVLTKKTALYPWKPCQRTGTIFELNSHWTINVTSRVFTCFHNIHIEKTAPPPGGHVFSPISTICKLFHDDWAKIVTSGPNIKTALPTGHHVFQRTGTTFELKTNILTK
ncbi:hypothetical protein DPMN_006207 [Dreissena polymorpha]|uniref:Uncharacterized protein n=1 Tax=Dreissena polymorpha TaxID=45954 RepID=A0A9D4MRJ8_DREPO|nr:hypothetical protein DPMN_006207 [Dreissena polymorpha]